MVNNDLEKKQQQRTRIGLVATNPENGKKPTASITLTEAKQKARENRQQRRSDNKANHADDLVKDIYQNVIRKTWFCVSSYLILVLFFFSFSR